MARGWLILLGARRLDADRFFFKDRLHRIRGDTVAKLLRYRRRGRKALSIRRWFNDACRQPLENDIALTATLCQDMEVAIMNDEAIKLNLL